MRVDRFGRADTSPEGTARVVIQGQTFDRIQFAYTGRVWGVAVTQDWATDRWSPERLLLSRYYVWQTVGAAFGGSVLSCHARFSGAGHLLFSGTGMSRWQAWRTFLRQVYRVEQEGSRDLEAVHA